MNMKIVSDSGSNIQTLSGEIPFENVALKIITDEKEFHDNLDLDVADMVDFLKQYRGKSGSACPSVQDFYDAFGNAQYVFVFTITSSLSGSYNAARLAKEAYEADYPDRKVCLVDTLSAGPEMKLLIEFLQELLSSEGTFEEICEAILAKRQQTGLTFLLESMQNLANNGRISPIIAKFAGLIGIRALGYASDKGELAMLDKCRGEKKALTSMVHHLKSLGYQGGRLRIDHCQNPSLANRLSELMLGEFPDADIQIAETCGLCSFYAEKGGLMIGFEKGDPCD